MIEVAQRSDYTFKFNKNIGRHGWLRLTPAYSVKLVQELVEETPRNAVILDPFSGTGTTGVCAAESGMHSHLFDINPFLIWFGNTKCANFKKSDLDKTKDRVYKLLPSLQLQANEENWVPPLHNIERWWCGHTLPILSGLRALIENEFGEPGECKYANLVWISFCRLIIETSSAAFNHVSMSFKGGVTRFEVKQIEKIFCDVLELIVESAKQEFPGTASVFDADSREMPSIDDCKYDHVITSPPYPNRMSYIRELRPYMYWTRFLNEAKEAGQLDWKAIGGTWGTATSKLKEWCADNIALPEELYITCEKISQCDNKNADLMGRYVHKYFHDMHLHFASLRSRLNAGAKVDYIVGNSTFYGVHVNSETLFEESLRMLGYQEINSRVVRKRNSKKELFEFCVTARWHG